MVAEVKVGTFQGIGTAPPADIAVTGVGFQPSAVILWWSGTQSIPNTTSFHAYGGVGFGVDSTNRGCVIFQSPDQVNGSTPADGVIKSDTLCGAIDSSGADDGKLDLKSMDSDGFTVTVDQQFTDTRSDNLIYGYMAIGGLENVAFGIDSFNSTGSKAVTGVGFEPGCVLFASPIRNGEDAGLSFGAGISSTERYQTYSSYEHKTSANSSAGSYSNGLQVIAGSSTGQHNITERADLESMDSDGFTLDVEESSGLTVQYIWLAMKGPEFSLQDSLTRTDGNDIKITTTFQPIGGFVVSHCRTEDANDTGVDGDAMHSIGGFTGTTERITAAWRHEDNLLVTDVNLSMEDRGVYTNVSNGGGIDGQMDVKSMDTDGVTFVMDNTDPSQNFFWTLLFSQGATATPEPISAPFTVVDPAVVIFDRRVKLRARPRTRRFNADNRKAF